jgi:RNA polymerase sigma-70 factor, ECF subfamily
MAQLEAPEDFRAAEAYRRELTAHCYRMTGSLADAEDLVQETYLRAWRAYDGFEGRSSVRTWLHRIATNVCLTALEGKDRRPLPTGLGAPGSRPSDDLVQDTGVPWLEPVPDSVVDDDANVDPAQVVANRDAVRLAFVAALQHLPPRQRAVLVLRDVLRWPASEVAAAMGTSTAAVNSALQRAHAQLEQHRPGQAPEQAAEQATGQATAPQLDAEQRAMLERYVEAFWEKDVDRLATMLTEDAVWEMPPFTGWYAGPRDIAALIDTRCPGDAHDMPMLATTANGQPAFGLYMRRTDGHFEAFQLQVLELRGTQVAHVVAFFDTGLFSRFGLPESLPASHR